MSVHQWILEWNARWFMESKVDSGGISKRIARAKANRLRGRVFVSQARNVSPAFHVWCKSTPIHLALRIEPAINSG